MDKDRTGGGEWKTMEGAKEKRANEGPPPTGAGQEPHARRGKKHVKQRSRTAWELGSENQERPTSGPPLRGPAQIAEAAGPQHYKVQAAGDAVGPEDSLASAQVPSAPASLSDTPFLHGGRGQPRDRIPRWGDPREKGPPLPTVLEEALGRRQSGPGG